MDGMKQFTMKSGVTLEVAPAPFQDAWDLFQLVLAEVRGVAIKSDDQATEMMKNLVCAGFSSKPVEKALKKCLYRCMYGGKKIDDTTFEPVEARPDFIQVCVTVAKENIDPFVKSLYSEYKTLLGELKVKDAQQ